MTERQSPYWSNVMNRYLPLMAGPTLLLLAGCMVGPKYTRPAAPIAPTFKEAPTDQSGWTPGQPSDAALRTNWWEMYQDPQLNALEAQVNGANQTLKIAEANFRSARAAIGLAKSRESPTIGTGASVGTLRESANEPYFLTNLANNGGGNFTMPIDMNYEIDLWGRIRRGVTAAREQAQASDADMESVRLSLHAELATDYFGLRSADGQEKLLDDTIKAYKDALQLTQDRFNGGLALRSDVTQAEAQLDQARVSAPTKTCSAPSSSMPSLSSSASLPPLSPFRAGRSMSTRPLCRPSPAWCPLPCLSVVRISPRTNAAWPPPTSRSASPRPRTIQPFRSAHSPAWKEPPR